MRSTPPEDKLESLPIISLSAFLSDAPSEKPTSAQIETAKQLDRACQEHGFFYLSDHGVSQELLDRVIDVGGRFFTENSAEEKMKIKVRSPDAEFGGDGARGYQMVGENVTQGLKDWHEAIDFYAEHPNTSESPPYKLLHGRNLYPSYPSEFTSTFKSYFTTLQQIATPILTLISLALSQGTSDTLHKALLPDDGFSSFWISRLISYPPLPPRHLGLSCGEHTDYGLLTLLHTDGTPDSLEVKTRMGEWIGVQPVRGTFVVNVGDMMEVWTGGRWKSTLHRVVHRGMKRRVSVPFFLEPSWEAEIRPLPGMSASETVDDVQRSKNYVGVGRYGEYLLGKVSGNFELEGHGKQRD